jgi:hypothetical protein
MKLPFKVSPLWLPGLLFAFGLVFATGASSTQPIVDRNPQQMCEEVAYELNIQVEEGMLGRERAEEITARCFRIFVNAK